MKVKIEVVKFEGKCSAGYKAGDVFYLNKFF